MADGAVLKSKPKAKKKGTEGSKGGRPRAAVPTSERYTMARVTTETKTQAAELSDILSRARRSRVSAVMVFSEAIGLLKSSAALEAPQAKKKGSQVVAPPPAHKTPLEVATERFSLPALGEYNFTTFREGRPRAVVTCCSEEDLAKLSTEDAALARELQQTLLATAAAISAIKAGIRK